MADEITAAEAIFNKGILVDLHIGRWLAQKKLSKFDLGLDKVDTSVIYLGHKKLLPKEALEPLAAVERRARVYLANHSVSFPIRNSAFVFNSALEAVLRKLDAFQAEWDLALAGLLTKYPEYIEKQLVCLDAETDRVYLEKSQLHVFETPEAKTKRMEEATAWAVEQRTRNRSLYPTPFELSRLFSFSRRLFKISAAEGIAGVSNEDLLRAQNELKIDLQQWVKDSTTEMHQDLGEAAKRSLEMLEKHDKLTPRNLRPLYEALSTFQAMDFNHGSEMVMLIEGFKKSYFASPPNSTDVNFEMSAELIETGKVQVKELLLKMSKMVDEAAAHEAAMGSLKKGEFARCLDL